MCSAPPAFDRRQWPAWVILAICLGLTAVIQGRARRVAEQRQAARFEEAINATLQDAELTHRHYINFLKGIKAYAELTPDVTLASFQGYLRSLELQEDHRGLLDFGYVARVAREDYARHVQTIRQEGHTNYTPHLNPAARESYPVVYLEDFRTENIRLAGWNAWSDPTRRAAMETARDRAAAAATSQVPLLRAEGTLGARGFVVYLPVYGGNGAPGTVAERRAALRGFVFGSFTSAELFASMLEPPEQELVRFRVYDGREPDPGKLIFDSAPGFGRGADFNRVSRLVNTRYDSRLEREWSFVFDGLPALESGPENLAPLVASGVGAIASVTLFGLAWFLVRERHQAETMAAGLRQSQAALRQSQERLRSVVASAPVVLFALDREGTFTVSDGRGLVALGLRPGQLVGRSVFDVYGDHPGICRAVRRTLAGEDLTDVVEIGPLVFDVRYAALRDERGQPVGVLGVAADITESRRLEKERLKTTQLESIGVLAGGIAHDFNNILGIILANVSLIPSATAGVERDQHVVSAEKACHRARELTQQLLTFAKGGAPVKAAADLVEILRDSAAFATPGAQTRCQFELASDLAPVEVDAGQISQVIQNLVLNARQAMPEGGVITVRARNVILPGPQPVPLAPGAYVQVSVEDCGVGIPAENLDRIFDPYFTTKPQGSGLGLAVAHSILARHGGLLTARSQPGKGSCFECYLPATNRPRVPVPPAVKAPAVNQGRILFMDDEPAIGKVAQNALGRQGFSVTVVTHGEAAVDRYRHAMASGQPYAAVVLDLTIPGGVGGVETLRRLKALDPQVRALASSGYSNDPVMAEFERYGFRGVAAKPYRIQDLTDHLHRVLNSV